MRTELINARGKLTQTEAAEQLDISQKHLSKLEQGQRTPSLKLAIRISSFYGKDIKTLFSDVFDTVDL